MREDVYGRDLPLALRLLGCWALHSPTYRFNWGEFTPGWGLALSYKPRRHVHVHALWGSWFFNIPGRDDDYDFDGPSYGFSVVDRAVHLHWGKRFALVHFPWDWTHVRHDVFDKDGVRHKYQSEHGDWVKGADGGHWGPVKDDHRHKETHPFTYTLRNGEIQERTATIYGDEMEWRWRWFKWLPWPRMINRSISVSFSDEVGERTGSWKGGAVGCGYEWRAGETMLDCLRRMERDRKFK